MRSVRKGLDVALVLMASSLLLMILIAPSMAKGGFDQYGFNYSTRMFNGILENWIRLELGLPPWQEGEPYMFFAGATRMVSRWNELFANAWYGPDHIVDSGDETFWVPGAARFHEFKWKGSETEPKVNRLLKILVAPLDTPPSPDAEDLMWGYPTAEDGTVLCFWCIFEIRSGEGPVTGPAHPNGLGAYK